MVDKSISQSPLEDIFELKIKEPCDNLSTQLIGQSTRDIKTESVVLPDHRDPSPKFRVLYRS